MWRFVQKTQHREHLLARLRANQAQSEQFAELKKMHTHTTKRIWPKTSKFGTESPSKKLTSYFKFYKKVFL